MGRVSARYLFGEGIKDPFKGEAPNLSIPVSAEHGGILQACLCFQTHSADANACWHLLTMAEKNQPPALA